MTQLKNYHPLSGMINVSTLSGKKITTNVIERVTKQYEERVETNNFASFDQREKQFPVTDEEKLLNKTPSLQTNNSQK